MDCLSKEQIDFIRSDLRRRKVSRSFLFEEWVDHVCCDVETLMGRGVPFEEAYYRVAGEAPDEQVRSAQQAVQQFLNHKYVGIKKLLLLAFLLFAAGWIVNPRTATNWIGLVSFLILSGVFLRISLDFLGKRTIGRVNVLLAVFSFLSFLGTLSGIMLIFLNRDFGVNTRGHGVDLTVFGWFFFSLACLMYYVREFRTAIETREMNRYGWFIALSAFNVFLASLSIASFPLYPLVQDRLYLLIGIILGFDVLAIGFLLLTRSMKHTLMLSLVIGSFMIVFIHSSFRSKLPGGKPKLYHITLRYTPADTLHTENPPPDKLYISMFYDRFPDSPITLPLKKSAESSFEIVMPAHAYKGYLYYAIEEDSSDAAVYFSRTVRVDSIRLDIPERIIYPLYRQSGRDKE